MEIQAIGLKRYILTVLSTEQRNVSKFYVTAETTVEYGDLYWRDDMDCFDIHDKKTQ
jgi:hypothetical protein